MPVEASDRPERDATLREAATAAGPEDLEIAPEVNVRVYFNILHQWLETSQRPREE